MYNGGMEGKDMITAADFRDAKKALLGGTAPVCAHGMDWPQDEWKRVLELKAAHGAFFARFFAPEQWTQIDGLEIRK